MQLRTNYIPDNAKCSTHHAFDNGKASGITIHWVGPYPNQTPDIVRDWWITSGGEASTHFIVKDKDVLQCWPLERVAWHAGCRPGNYQSIGIEVIPATAEGDFSDDSIETLKELIAYINTQLGSHLPVVRHFDWTGKLCPQYYCDTNKWKDLLRRII